MAYFLTSDALPLALLKHQSDPTVQFLYKISKQLIMSGMGKENRSVKSVGSVLEDMKRRIENVVHEDENIPSAVVKTIKDCINKSLESIDKQSKRLERENTADPSQSSTDDNKHTERDLLFIESMSKRYKSKSWKHISNEGKVQGLLNYILHATFLRRLLSFTKAKKVIY